MSFPWTVWNTIPNQLFEAQMLGYYFWHKFLIYLLYIGLQKHHPNWTNWFYPLYEWYPNRELFVWCDLLQETSGSQNTEGPPAPHPWAWSFLGNRWDFFTDILCLFFIWWGGCICTDSTFQWREYNAITWMYLIYITFFALSQMHYLFYAMMKNA